MRKKIIIDCDPGHDDMMAMILALASPELEVLAITTSAGNQTQAKTHSNAKKILELLKRTDIPVAKGAEKPLVRDLIIAPQVHGESGLDGADLPKGDFASDKRNAVELMRDIVRESRDPVSLVVTGPMTNAALFIAVYPELAKKLECISFMGGSVYHGNWSPAAEFNILVDPEAAKLVMASGIPLIMSGLEVTHKAQLMPDDIAKMRSMNTTVSAITADLMDYFLKSASAPLFAPEGHIEGAHMHDPCAIAVLLDSSRFKTAELFGDIELYGQYCVGRTVIDTDGVLKKEPNVTVAFDLDNNWMRARILDAVASFK
ncbi:MAG: nucleoside hydrolase [Erysipelotrichaceae bacterium]|jgi:pyrimidine-specific ribonucleoside hydrolase|nr:nucleoside hydrolase [Erysipelotrichaceae bacterium]